MSNIALDLRVTQNELFSKVVYADGTPVAQENADGTVTLTLAQDMIVKEKPSLVESKAYRNSRSAQTGSVMDRIAQRRQPVALSWRKLSAGDAVVLRADQVIDGREYLALDDDGKYAWLNAKATGGATVTDAEHAELRASALETRDRIRSQRSRNSQPTTTMRAPF